MGTAPKVVLGIPIALLLLAALAAGVGALLWGRATARAVAGVEARTQTPAPGPTAELPPPVRRYLDRALPGGRASIRVARIRQSGEFLLRPPDGWAPFTATQLFTGQPPGMVWNASIRMAPLVSVRVRDSYIDGVGTMHGAVLGLVAVLRQSGPAEMAQASLLRYLAEAAWFPSRLRPSPSLRWTPVDDATAVATLRDGDVTAQLEFRFNDGDEIAAVYAARRYRGETEDPTWAPWIGRFGDYRAFDGFRVPTTGVVAWVLDGEERPYWRGRIEAVRYEY